MKAFDHNSESAKRAESAQRAESAELPTASLSEQNLDKLLTGFFQSEMPSEIKALSGNSLSDLSGHTHRATDSPVFVRPAQSTRQSQSHTNRAWFGVATAAAMLMVAVIGLSLNSSAPETPVAGLMTSPSLQNPIDKDQTTVELFDLEDGAVEQRTNLRWKNVSTNDPGSGETIQWIMPELEMEIFDVAEADASTTVRG